MAAKEYAIKFTLMTIKATLDDERLKLKVGLRNFDVPVAQLKYLYVLDHENVGYELLLAYEPFPNQTKRVRFNADLGDAGFKALIDDLIARRPEIDIRDKSVKEAHELMGATNFVAMAPVIATLLITGGVAIGFLPSFIHGCDGGHQTLAVAELASPDFTPETSNLTLTGQLLREESMVVTTTQDGRTSTESFIPLVPPDWQRGDPVAVIVNTGSLSVAESGALNGSAGIRGVLRNVLWEGLGGDDQDFFRNEIGLRLAPHVYELEYDADAKLGMYIGFGAVGFVLVLMFIVSIIIKRRQAK